MNHIVYNLDMVDIDFFSQSQKTIDYSCWGHVKREKEAIYMCLMR